MVAFERYEKRKFLFLEIYLSGFVHGGRKRVFFFFFFFNKYG